MQGFSDHSRTKEVKEGASLPSEKAKSLDVVRQSFNKVRKKLTICFGDSQSTLEEESNRLRTEGSASTENFGDETIRETLRNWYMKKDTLSSIFEKNKNIFSEDERSTHENMLENTLKTSNEAHNKYMNKPISDRKSEIRQSHQECKNLLTNAKYIEMVKEYENLDNDSAIDKYTSLFEKANEYKEVYNESLPKCTDIAAFNVFFRSQELRKEYFDNSENKIVKSREILGKLDQALSFYKECLEEHQEQVQKKVSSIESALDGEPNAQVSYGDMSIGLKQWVNMVQEQYKLTFENINQLHTQKNKILEDININNNNFNDDISDIL